MMKKNIFPFLSILFVGFCAFAKPGSVISFEKYSDLPKAMLDDYQKSQSLEFPNEKEDPLYDVQRYKIIYETTDVAGKPTTASGMLLVPKNKTQSFPLVSYQHGTILKRDKAPSGINSDAQLLAAIGIASRGFTISMADYLGLGENPGMHLYHHAETEATASADMLRAVRSLQTKLKLKLTGDFFLTGYSQGGHATLALQRHLEQNPTSEFSAITASVPMAGAYNFEPLFDELLKNPTKNTPIELAYLVIAFQSIYGNIGSVEQVFSKDYDWADKMFDGTQDWNVAWQGFREAPLKMFNKQFLNAYKMNPKHPLKVAFRENSFEGFKATSPTYFVHGKLDKEVPYTQSVQMVKRLLTAGSEKVQLITVDGDHAGASSAAMLTSVQLFRKIMGAKK